MISSGHLMRHSREKGKRLKPVKKHRPGYKGSKRKKLMDSRRRKLAAEKRRAEKAAELHTYLFTKFKIPAGDGD